MSKNPAFDYFDWNFIKDRKLWVTSDSHFHHKNICRGTSEWGAGCRDFDTLEEMDRHILREFNRPEEDDVIIHGGDWSFGGKDQIELFRNQIRCKTIILTFGNHDQHLRKDFRHLFWWTGDYFEMAYKGILITISHYPIGSWRDLNKGAINLHGHSHGNYKPLGRQKDVGLDACGMNINRLDDIVAELRTIPIVKVDHH